MRKSRDFKGLSGGCENFGNGFNIAAAELVQRFAALPPAVRATIWALICEVSSAAESPSENSSRKRIRLRQGRELLSRKAPDSPSHSFFSPTSPAAGVGEKKVVGPQAVRFSTTAATRTKACHAQPRSRAAVNPQAISPSSSAVDLRRAASSEHGMTLCRESRLCGLGQRQPQQKCSPSSKQGVGVGRVRRRM